MTLPRDTAGSPAERTRRARPDPTGPDDAALMDSVVAGDAAALEQLYSRYGRASYALARRLLGDDGLAQDVVQEVFLTVWRDAVRFDRSRGGFSTWLLTMTHHKAVDSVRKEENLRRRRTTADVLEDRESDQPRVDEQVWASVRRERVRAALADLPIAQREALGLAYYGGYTQREIAGLTATPLGTVKTRMLMGMRRLRDNLEGVGPHGNSPDSPDSHTPRPLPPTGPSAPDLTGGAP